MGGGTLDSIINVIIGPVLIMFAIYMFRVPLTDIYNWILKITEKYRKDPDEGGVSDGEEIKSIEYE